MNQKEDARNDDLETIHKGVAEQQRRSLTLHKQTDKQLWITPEELVVKDKGQQGADILQKKDEPVNLPLIWFYEQGPRCQNSQRARRFHRK